MIVEHKTFVRNEQSFNLTKPFESAKFLLEVAFGLAGSSRPVVRNIEDNGIIRLINDENIFNIAIGALNNEFVESIPLEYDGSYSSEDFGHFFYEYGRTVLAMAGLTAIKAGWYSTDGISDELDRVYSNFIKLSGNVENIVNAFKALTESSDGYIFDYDYANFSKDLIKCYDDSKNSKYAPDMCNTMIVLSTYIGSSFVLLGTLLSLPTEIDPVSYLKGTITDSSIGSLTKGVFDGSDIPELKANMCRLCYIVGNLSMLYSNVSGVENNKRDFIMDKMGTFSWKLLAKISNMESSEIVMDELFDDLKKLLSISVNYNIFTEINTFVNALPKNDTVDIWKFGYTYLRGYKCDVFEDDPIKILDFYKPQMKNMVDNSVKGITNESIERGFNFISTILNGLDNNKISTVDPRTIIVLTTLAAAFRKIEKKDSISNDKIIESKVRAAIDLIDVIIISLYDLWFNSGKFFKQVERPSYNGEGAAKTLLNLKYEINGIIVSYLEYVRFGLSDTVYKSDEAVYRNFIKTRMMANFEELNTSEFITGKLFLSLDPDVFVRECAIRGCRSIVYSILSINKELDIHELCRKCSAVELPKQVIRAMAIGKKEEYTGLDNIDKVIRAMPMIKEYVQEEPFVYMLAVYCVLLDTIEHIFQSNNVGNYFDFKRPEESMNSYKLDSIVSELVMKPVEEVENSTL